MKFFCIGDEDTVRGFRLAGVSGIVATNAQEAGAALRNTAAQDDIGIIIVTQRVANNVRAEVDAIRLEREKPLIVELPGPEGWMKEHKGLNALVQQAVGIHVTFEGRT